MSLNYAKNKNLGQFFSKFMSFQLNWELLQDGKEALQLKEYLNERFSTIVRPNFLGEVSVSKLDFGTIPPKIAVENITDPMEEFYFDDISEDISNGSFFEERTDSFTEYSQDVIKLEKSELDAQVEVSIEYDGDMKMSISTELIVNQPTPNFLTLPLQLTVTKTSIKGI
jgi:distribution and morphology protein 12